MRTALLSSVCALALALATPAPAQTAPAPTGPRIAVPAHDIERGEVITASDLVTGTIAPERMRPGLATTEAELAGHEARRLLRAGEAVRVEDVRMPVLVTKGSTVTMVFEEPGISLTAAGRALSDGGLGDTIAVENPASFRQVSCVVTGRGTVRAGDATNTATGQVAENP